MSFWDKVKDFVGVEDDYIDDDFYGDYEDYDIEEDQEENSLVSTDEVKDEEEDNRSRREERSLNRKTNVVNLRESKDVQMVVSIREPLTYEDGKAVVDDITSGKSVVLNLEMLEVDKKTQIFYFVSGGVYALNGSIKNVTKDIYVIAPKGVNIDGQLKDDITNRSLYQV